MSGIQSSPNKYVFVSYSRKNIETVQRLIDDLQAHGIPVWIDNRGLKPGTRNWEQSLRDAISQSRLVLLAASPDARRSEHVQGELAVSEMYRRSVMPVWVDGSEWPDSIPLDMVKMQYVDLRAGHYAQGV